jgi:hypothetical protein
MSGAIAQQVAGIPMANAKLPGTNVLGLYNNILNTEQNEVKTQAALAQQRAAEIYQKSINPLTGQSDAVKLANMLAGDPEAAQAMQATQQTQADLQGTNLKNTGQGIANTTSQTALNNLYGQTLGDMAAGLIGQNLTGPEIRNYLGEHSTERGIPLDFAAPYIQEIPDDPYKANAGLTTIARTLEPVANTKNALSPEMGPIQQNGNQIYATEQSTGVSAPALVHLGQAGLGPTVMQMVNSSGNSAPSVVSTSGSNLSTQLPAAGGQLPVVNTDPNSLVPPAALQPPGMQGQSQQGAMAVQAGQAPAAPAPQPPAAQSPVGVAIQPIGGVSDLGGAEKDQLSNVIEPLNDSLQQINANYGKLVAPIDEQMAELKDANTGKLSGVVGTLQNAAAELGLPGMEGASAKEIFTKLAAAQQIASLPGGIGSNTDYGKMLVVASSSSSNITTQANQSILALAKGQLSAQKLAAQLVDKAGFLSNPGAIDPATGQLQYTKVLPQLGQINPLVYAYMYMNPANQSNFLQGLMGAQGTKSPLYQEFERDFYTVKALKKSVEAQ